jgi:hypothetical protein
MVTAPVMNSSPPCGVVSPDRDPPISPAIPFRLFTRAGQSFSKPGPSLTQHDYRQPLFLISGSKKLTSFPNGFCHFGTYLLTFLP